MPRIFYFVQRMIRCANHSFRPSASTCGCQIVGTGISKPRCWTASTATTPRRWFPVCQASGIHCLDVRIYDPDRPLFEYEFATQCHDGRRVFMVSSRITQSKAFSLSAFLSLYGTEDQCYEALYRWRWENGFLCPHCGHDQCCQLTSRKLQQCNRCHRQTSVTAGTILDSTRLPLATWFLAIYLMTQDKRGTTATRLHRYLGISYNAAWRMRRKVSRNMLEQDGKPIPVGRAGFDDVDPNVDPNVDPGGRQGADKRDRGTTSKVFRRVDGLDPMSLVSQQLIALVSQQLIQ